MNVKKRRAIVWNTIERIAFRPSSNNDRTAWLSVYAKTLHQLWGMEPTREYFAPDDNFSITFLNLKCRYIIETVSKYSISFLNDSSDLQLWQSHVDPGFPSKASLQTCIDEYPRRQLGELRRDVEAVLDGMLFHTRCHSHLDDLGVRHVQLDLGIGGLSSHEVRIGGGIENPYIFLFHLRYQFCLVSNRARENERTRLIDLFKTAIPKKESRVNARDLLNY